MRALLIVAVFALIAGACGGSEDTYAFAPIVDCMESSGVPMTTDPEDLDYIAQNAGVGAARSSEEDTEVTIVVERTPEDAERTESAYEVFGAAADAPTDDVLDRHGNVVVSWSRTPGESDLRRIDDCLKS